MRPPYHLGIAHDYCGKAQSVGDVDFTLIIGTNLVASDVQLQRVIIDALQAAPLGLTTRLDTQARLNGQIIGRALYQPSRVFPGWRELCTVRLDIDEGINTSFTIEVATTLYLNRQNTDRKTDWFLPSPSQSATYLQAVEGALKSNLSGFYRASWTGRTLNAGK
jgi:hypothetical protein